MCCYNPSPITTILHMQLLSFVVVANRFVAWDKMHCTWFSMRDGFSPTRHQILPSPLRCSGYGELVGENPISLMATMWNSYLPILEMFQCMIRCPFCSPLCNPFIHLFIHYGNFSTHKPKMRGGEVRLLFLWSWNISIKCSQHLKTFKCSSLL